MNSSKYGNVLTILLVVVIVAILGLLIYLGVDVYRKYYIEKDAKDIVDRFDEITSNLEKEDPVIEKPVGDIESPLANLNDANTSGGGGSNRVTYKGYGVLGTIKIPKTGVDYPVLERVTKKSIEVAVAYQYGPGLNKPGNTVIIGHNYRNNMFFSNNKKLEIGDKIEIKDETGTIVTYTIYNKYETTDSDTDYMRRDTGGAKEISLSTCTDDNARRLIIWAKE